MSLPPFQGGIKGGSRNLRKIRDCKKGNHIMTDYNTIAESNHFILLDKYGETP